MMSVPEQQVVARDIVADVGVVQGRAWYGMMPMKVLVETKVVMNLCALFVSISLLPLPLSSFFHLSLCV